MNILIVVASTEEEASMRRLITRATMPGYQFMLFSLYPALASKPTMKALRELKPKLDEVIKQHKFDYIIAAGETAARLALDTSAVNISKLRGRDFEYEFGIKKPSKKKAELAEPK